MEEIIIYKLIIIFAIILLGTNSFILNFYRIKYKSYRDKCEEYSAKLRLKDEFRKEQTEILHGEIANLKSLISLLSRIIKSKPAILAKDKLRFTFSVRANGKRVARVKPINTLDKNPTSVIGESMVEIEKGKYINLNKLCNILSVSDNINIYSKTEQFIRDLKQYTL